MNRLLAICFLFLSLSAWAADRVTVAVTVTNGTVNGDSFTLNGSTRTFTNSVYTLASDVLTNSTAAGTKTNLIDHISGYPFTSVQVSDGGATAINLIGNTALAMTAVVSGDWGYVTYTTQTVAQLTGVRVPVSGEAAAVQTNVASGLVAALNLSANTNELDQTAKVAAQLLGTTNTQTVAGAKSFTNAAGLWSGTISNTPGLTGTFGAVSNGIWWNGILRAPTITNGINYGNAFRSPGTGTSSEQFGSSADGSGDYSVAVGNAAEGSGDNSTAVGNTAVASADSAIAIGKDSTANATTGIAIGINSLTEQTNSVSLGASATATAANQIRLGTAAEHVSIPGGLHVAGSITNAPIVGYANLDGNLRLIRKAVTTLANGVNAAVPIATNSFVEVSGPDGAFSVDGIANGADGRLCIILNQTGQNMTIAHESGSDATAGNRIISLTGGDRATTANGAAILIYSAAASRWILISLDP